MQEMWARTLGQEALLDEEMATHSNNLAWKIPWAEEPVGDPYSLWGHKESDITDLLSMNTSAPKASSACYQAGCH